MFSILKNQVFLASLMSMTLLIPSHVDAGNICILPCQKSTCSSEAIDHVGESYVNCFVDTHIMPSPCLPFSTGSYNCDRSFNCLPAKATEYINYYKDTLNATCSDDVVKLNK